MTAATLTFAVPAHMPTLSVCAGRVMALAGLAFGAANLIQWGILSGALPWHPAALAVTWPAAVAVFLIGAVPAAPGGRRGGANGRRLVAQRHPDPHRRRLGSAGGRSRPATWGLMRWTSSSACPSTASPGPSPPRAPDAPTWRVVSATAFAGVGGLPCRSATPDQYLIQACALGLVALLPGLWLASAAVCRGKT